ncbi:MAG: hypothetical protein RLZZ507_4158 [Cyanobacteriota bacterium]|jgi:NRPS condensation-like uncharacterized protein
MDRTLVPTEKFMWLWYQQHPENVTFSVTITGKLNVDRLKEALAWLQQRHSRLRVKIVINAENQPQFSEKDVPPIPLKVIERQGEKNWCQEMVSELLIPLSWNQEPLMRVLLLISPDISNLLITFHHCIGDGISGTYLIRDILQFIGEPDSQKEILPDLPPIDQLLPETAKKISLVDETSPESIKYDSIFATHFRTKNKQPGCDDFKISLFNLTISVKHTNQLIARCREEKTTVHGALYAAFLLAIFAEINANEATIFRCHSPINIRKYLNIKIDENLGEYITRPIIQHQVSKDTDFWDLAREVKHKLNQVITEGKLFNDVFMVREIISNDAQTNVNILNLLDNLVMDIAITNLGILNIPQQFGHLQIEEVYVMATAPKTLPLLIGVATIGGKMCLIGRYIESIIPSENAQNIKERFMQQLLTFID